MATTSRAILDELADRVDQIERRMGVESGATGQSPARASEVSFGGDAPFKVPSHLEGSLLSEEFQSRLALVRVHRKQFRCVCSVTTCYVS